MQIDEQLNAEAQGADNVSGSTESAETETQTNEASSEETQDDDDFEDDELKLHEFPSFLPPKEGNKEVSEEVLEEEPPLTQQG